MITRLLFAFGIILIAAYLTTMTYIFVDTGWVFPGRYITILILGIAIFFRLPVLLAPVVFVGLSDFYGLSPLLSAVILIPLFALSSTIIKGMLFSSARYFYLNKAKLENRESTKL